MNVENLHLKVLAADERGVSLTEAVEALGLKNYPANRKRATRVLEDLVASGRAEGVGGSRGGQVLQVWRRVSPPVTWTSPEGRSYQESLRLNQRHSFAEVARSAGALRATRLKLRGRGARGGEVVAWAEFEDVPTEAVAEVATLFRWLADELEATAKRAGGARTDQWQKTN